jgi:hypothetical protein
VVARNEELERALDKGASAFLPPNEPPGWLGEVAPDLRKVDEFEPTLNSGISQEDSQQQRWLLMLIMYVTVVASPIALWLLWRDPARSRRAKVVTTIVGIVCYVAAFIVYRLLHS